MANDILSDADDLSINQLISVLSKYDVDLPAKRMKRQIYVELYNQHLDYMKKRRKDEEYSILIRSIRKTIRKKPIINSPKTPQTPIIEGKKRAVSENEVFSEDNPFQSPNSSRLKTRIKKLDLKDKIDINFGGSLEIKDNDPQNGYSPNQDSEKFKPSPRTARKSPRSAKKLKSPNTQVDDVEEYRLKEPETPIKFVDSTLKVDSLEDTDVVEPMEKLPIPSKSSMDARKRLQERLLSKSRAKKTRNMIWRFFLAIMGLFFLFLAHWLAVDQPKLQYCTDESNTIMFYKFLPSCIPCPKHATCQGRQITGCAVDYKLQTSAFQFFFPRSLLVFPLDQPICVFDSNVLRQSKKIRQVEHLGKVINEIVREFLGNAICQPAMVPQEMSFVFSNSKVLGMPVSLAREKLQSLVKSKWADDEFEEYWQLLVEKILEGAGPVSSVFDQSHQHRMFTTTSPPKISMSCRLRLAFWRTIVAYSTHLLVGSFVLLFSFFGYNQYQQRTYESSIAKALVEDVLEAVHAETDNYHLDSTRHPFPGLSILQLQDHFLPPRPSNSETSLDEQGRTIYHLESDTRERVWKSVCSIVGSSSCIRETSCVIKGETFVVWMWIGSAALSPKKRVRTDVGVIPTVGTRVVTP